MVGVEIVRELGGEGGMEAWWVEVNEIFVERLHFAQLL